MYIRRKLYSYVEGEYVPVNETKLFAAKDDAKGAAVGAGIAAGTAGVGVAGLYGAGKVGHLIRKNRVLANRAEVKEAQSVINSLKKDEGLMKLKVGQENLKKAQENAKNAGQKAAGKLEKNLIKSGKFLGKHKVAAGLTAAGTIAAGAGVGAGVAHLKDKKAEEKVYSVLMTEDELRMFNEIAKDAGIGAGAVAGTAGLGVAAVKGVEKTANRVQAVRRAHNIKNVKEANSVVESLEKEVKAGHGSEKMKETFKKNLGKAQENAANVKKNLKDASKIEKGLQRLARGGASATKWVKDNPKLAASIAAGTIAAGAGVGAGVGAIKDKK